MPEIAPALQQTVEAAQGAGLRAEATRERASPLIAAGAAMGSWLTSDIYRWVTKPDFGAADPTFSLQSHIATVPFQLNDSDREFLANSNNSESWQYHLDALQKDRERMRAMGDSPITAFAVGIIDPTYLAADAASFGAARFVTAGRAARAAAGATTAAGASLVGSAISSEVRPIETREIILDALFNAGATGLAAGLGGKLVKADPDFKGEQYQKLLQGPEPVGVTGNLERSAEVARTQHRTLGERFADKAEFSIHNKLSEVDQEFADLTVSSIRRPVTSIEDNAESIRREFSTAEYKYEDNLNKLLSENGAGALMRPVQTAKALQVQQDVQKQVMREVWRREQAVNAGIDPKLADGADKVNPRIASLVDDLDSVTGLAANTGRQSGIEGAEQLYPKSGWLPRRWNVAGYNDIHKALSTSGMADKQADDAIKGLVAKSLRAANKDMPEEVAKDIAASQVNRMKRKGLNEDTAFFTRKNSEEYKTFRDFMLEEGLPTERVQRVLDYLTGVKAERDKASFLKHRLDMDYNVTLDVGGQKFSVVDMFDTNVSTLLSNYLDGMAGRSAMARKGWTSDVKAIEARDAFMQKVRASTQDAAKIQEYENLVDNVMQYLKGRPAGDELGKAMRITQSLTRSTALSASGLWQVTEYAPAMAHYGALKTMKYALQELPLMRSVFSDISKNPSSSTRLLDILARSGYQDTRLRPILQRYDDGFAIPVEDLVTVKLQQATQLVPYVNGMKYVQHNQARMMANLVFDRIQLAVNGDAKAIKTLEQYGLTKDIMESLRSDIQQFGTDTAKWSDGTWEKASPSFIKMMDEGVLKARLGETPAWVAFDKLGKFIFTFRSFTVAAHNKILVGTAAKDGMGPLALIMMYQFPLAMLATQANEVSRGKPALELDALAAKAAGQVGALGLISEPVKVLTGETRQWGAPGLIALDRGYNLFSSGAAAMKASLTGSDAHWGKVGAAALSATPVLSIAPLSGALQTILKTQE